MSPTSPSSQRTSLPPFPEQSLPRIVAPVPGPRSVALVDRLARVECPALTPHRPRPGLLGGVELDPPVWSSARGVNVLDVDDNLYVDLSSFFAVTSVGHAHPEVVRAGQEQLARLPHAMGDVYFEPRRVELLERLCRETGLDRAMLASSGSDAVEAALKTARVATGRDRVWAFHGGYHGLSYGALSVTGFRRDFFCGPFKGQLAGHTSFSDFGGPLPDFEGIGAVIVEPIQGRGGIRVPPSGWLQELEERAHKAGALVILDEIFTGFGRTGTPFAFQFEKLHPDLLCLGKGMASGFPISATLGTARVMDAWGASTGEAPHTQTFLGNPTGCAMALATLEIMERDTLYTRSARVGARWMERLGALKGVRELRGRGLMIGMDLGSPGAGVEIGARLLERGWIVLPCGEEADTLSLVPPLVIEEGILEAFVVDLDGVMLGKK